MSFRGEFEQARDFLILHRSDYDYAYAHFKWPQLEEFNWALDYFDPMAALNNHLALWIVDELGVEQKATFEELSMRSNQVANFLRKQGLKKGDSILLLLENEMALWEIMLGAMKIGAVLVPASPLLSHQELQDRMDRENIKAIATNQKHSQKFSIEPSAIVPILVNTSLGDKIGDKWISYSEVRNERTSFVHSDAEKTKAQDPLFRYFVSTNAVKPKIIEHTHYSYPVGHLSTMFWMGVHPGDIHLGISSSGWAMHDWNNFLTPWNAEATIFIYKQERFNAQKILAAMSKYKVTTFCAPPTVWRLLAQEDLKNYNVSLREALSTGETLNADTVSTFHKAWNIFIREGYGQTEMPMVIGVSPSEKNSFGTMGKVLPGFRVQLLDSEGKEADGEICIEIEEGPLKLIAGAPEGSQIFRTGDFAYNDYAGNFTFSQRADALFKSSDYRVSPFEVEAVLAEFPAIREAVVIPSPDPIRDFVPKALISVVKGVEPTRELALDIMSFTRQRLAPFKRVRRVEFAEIPKSTSGEIPRSELAVLEKNKRARGQKSIYEFWEEDAKISLAEAWAQELP